MDPVAVNYFGDLLMNDLFMLRQGRNQKPHGSVRLSPIPQCWRYPASDCLDGLVGGALDCDDSIGAISEPNEGPYFGGSIFPSLGLPTADGARVLEII